MAKRKQVSFPTSYGEVTFIGRPKRKKFIIKATVKSNSKVFKGRMILCGKGKDYYKLAKAFEKEYGRKPVFPKDVCLCVGKIIIPKANFNKFHNKKIKIIIEEI